jgi:hypothetical protein
MMFLAGFIVGWLSCAALVGFYYLCALAGERG